MMKKVFLRFMLILALTSLFVGCGEDEKDSQIEKENQEILKEINKKMSNDEAKKNQGKIPDLSGFNPKIEPPKKDK